MKNFIFRLQHVFTIPFLLVLYIGPLQAEPIRILPLGDSITQGRGRGSAERPAVYSYRYPLWKMLIDRGVEFDYVGSIDNGFDSHHFGDPDYPDYQGHVFDKDHEGHWGWRTDQILNSLPGWLAGYTPDITLILLGTNDARWSEFNLESTLSNMNAIINLLRQKNPGMVIFVGLPFQGYNEHFGELRTSFQDLAEEVTTPESPVIAVGFPGWVNPADEPGTDTVDGDHPNQQGDEKLASNWMKALEPFVLGSYDKWQKENFENPELEEAARNSDPDRDGYHNLMEYVLGMNPLEKDPGLMGFQLTVNGESVSSRFTPVSGLGDVHYQVEGSADFHTWDTVLFDSSADTVPETGVVEIERESTMPYFFRLRVTEL